MSFTARSLRTAGVLTAALLTLLSGPAFAADADEDNTRAVRIIDAPPETPPAALAPLPPLPDLPAPAPSPAPVVAAPIPVPAPLPAAPAPAPVPALAAPASPPAPSKVPGNTIYDVTGVQPRPVELGTSPQQPDKGRQALLGAIPIDPKVANTAQLSLELLPGLDIAIGSKVAFRVTAKKPGYLILVDVDATGKLTQIYPVPNAVVGATRPPRPNANYIAAGKSLDIPSAGDNYSGIEYIASPPSGVAMIVAILSDRPVQMLDLPDVPTALTGQSEALTFLTKIAQELRIPQADSGRLLEARWSFDAKFYAIR